MLPKSQMRVYVGYDDSSKSVKLYSAQSRKVFNSRSYRFLNPPEGLTPPEEIAITPDPMREGEAEGSTRKTADNSRVHEENVRAPQDTAGIVPEEPGRTPLDVHANARKAPRDSLKRKYENLEIVNTGEPRRTRGKRSYRLLADTFKRRPVTLAATETMPPESESLYEITRGF